jgi:hypothetical protein
VTTKTVTFESVDALTALLDQMNAAGLPEASVAFVDAQGVTGVAYLIEVGGDDVQAVFLQDPGPSRGRGGPHDDPGDESYIGYFEQDPDAELTAPIMAIYFDESQVVDPVDGEL